MLELPELHRGVMLQHLHTHRHYISLDTGNRKQTISFPFVIEADVFVTFG